MGLFKRNKQATERVQDLKNRVESLRKVDDEHRALTLDDFLGGDDAITARTQPRYPSAGPSASQDVNEGSLEAELQRYLSAHSDEGEEEREAEPLLDEVIAAPGFEAPASKAAPVSAVRPISIDEFPPLPPMPERTPEAREPASPAGPPRLSADEEAALIAELQRYLKTDNVEGNEDVLGEPVAASLDDEVQPVAWPEPQAFDSAAPSVDAEDGEIVVLAFPEESAEAEEAKEDVPEAQASRVVELDGRTYEEPAPRHWPSVPLRPIDEPGASEPEPRRRAVGDWEPL